MPQKDDRTMNNKQKRKAIIAYRRLIAAVIAKRVDVPAIVKARRVLRGTAFAYCHSKSQRELANTIRYVAEGPNAEVWVTR